MARFFVAGVAAMTLFMTGAVLGLLTEGEPPYPHVRLADRASTIATDGEPGSNIEGLWPTIRPGQVYAHLNMLEQAKIVAAEEAAMLAEEVAPQQASQPAQASSASSEWDGTGTPCAIPQYICDRESGGDPTVYNTEGSGASGKYQFMHGTWDGYGGYENAADAPESVQDQKARELWADGAGCSHWSACG